MSDLAKNAQDWLNQQIEQLGALRNASTRDPQFKQWRQNTLTFIQRIWPEDTVRSERFRRIPFSPPSSKHDLKTGREFYERGCAEALDFLQALLKSVDEDGIAAAPAAMIEEDTTPDGSEEDFPLLELPGAEEESVEAEAEPEAEAETEPEPEPQRPARSVGPPPVPARRGPRTPGATHVRPGPTEPEAGTPPPARADEKASEAKTLPVSEVAIPPVPTRSTGARHASGPPRISVRGTGASKKSGGERESAKTNPLENILRPVEPPPPAEPPAKTGKPGRGGKKNGHKQRLKDMLGFGELESRAESDDEAAPPAPAAESPKPQPPARPSKPPGRGSRRGGQESGRLTLPEFMVPEEPADESDRLSPEDFEPHVLDREEPPPRRPTLARQPDPAGERGPVEPHIIEETPRGLIEADDVEAISEVESGALDEEAASPELLESDLELEEDPTGLEAREGEEEEGAREDTSAVTAEFVLNSPVLSSKPRPAKREQPAPALQALQAQSPAAAALLALASDVNTLGIPEGNRAWARAALVDLARRIESGQLSWEALREAVHFLMEFPPLARRVLPLLLPFFEKAA
ncbi:MAG TPA: hypothetical protein VMJ70_01925 [Candidatus Sulfotelmatobacter sp.]|nr:hypothetical protein [Candidatus Sulfotelmatobacter sp.]